MIEGIEGFRLTITPSPNYVIGSSGGSGGSSHDVQITDVPPTISLGYSYYTNTVSEGGTTYVSLYRSGGDTSEALSVNMSLNDNNFNDPLAIYGTDFTLTASGGSASFTSTGGTATFAAGSSYISFVVEAKRDNLIEGNEGFRLTIDPGVYLIGSSGGSGGSSGGYQDVRISDDPPTVSFGGYYGSGGVSEGNTTYIYLYRSGGDSSQSLTVNLSIGTDGQGDPLAQWGGDYTLTTNGGGSASLNSNGSTVTFAAGSNVIAFKIDAHTDTIAEETEGFRLSINTAPEYLVGFSGG